MNVILKLQGGLGNQMFQYAFGRSIQEKTGAKLILDISDFQYDKAGRKYALGPFNISNNIELDGTGKYNMKYDQRRNWVIKLGVKLCPELLYLLGSLLGIYIWEDVRFKSVYIKKERANIYIHGLWQSERYFHEISEMIRNELHVNTKVSKEDDSILKKMQRENSVCVHIRRGDYLNKNNNLYICQENYYNAAMDYIEKTLQDPHYYIFSDDIRYVKNNFDFGRNNIEYMQEYRADYEEFRLMYHCQNFIIANSTFSWWASYLNENNGIVISPKQWYENKTDISNLIRSDMICL